MAAIGIVLGVLIGLVFGWLLSDSDGVPGETFCDAWERWMDRE